MKSTIYRLLSLVLLGSSITLFSMDNDDVPKPNFEQLDEIAAEPLGSDTEDVSTLRSDFNALKQELWNTATEADEDFVINELEQLRTDARQQGEQQLAYDIAQFLGPQ